jgi:ketopantoate reductase
MKVIVLGAGAVGAYHGGLLARAGHEVRGLLKAVLTSARSYPATRRPRR